MMMKWKWWEKQRIQTCILVEQPVNAIFILCTLIPGFLLVSGEVWEKCPKTKANNEVLLKTYMPFCIYHNFQLSSNFDNLIQ